MTTQRQCRCIHCGVLYDHFTSGYECRSETSTYQYCTECQQAILDALKAIPRLFELRRIVIVDPDPALVRDVLRKVEEKELEYAKLREAGKIVVRRVFPSLFDLENPRNINKVERVEVGGETHYVSYWSEDKGKTKTRIELRHKREYNLLDQSDRPWVDGWKP